MQKEHQFIWMRIREMRKRAGYYQAQKQAQRLWRDFEVDFVLKPNHIVGMLQRLIAINRTIDDLFLRVAARGEKSLEAAILLLEAVSVEEATGEKIKNRSAGNA